MLHAVAIIELDSVKKKDNNITRCYWRVQIHLYTESKIPVVHKNNGEERVTSRTSDVMRPWSLTVSSLWPTSVIICFLLCVHLSYKQWKKNSIHYILYILIKFLKNVLKQIFKNAAITKFCLQVKYKIWMSNFSPCLN